MNNSPESPLVTAIIIFLNEQRFLPEAIESVMAQSYQNIELLLVDDGSTDQSTHIARDFAERNPHRLFYLEHKDHANCGMSASRNLGISQAKGKYVAFLDADDVWTPDKIDEQVRIMESKPEVSMVYGRTLIWHSWSGNPQEESRDYFYPLGFFQDTLVHPCTLTKLLLANKTQSPTTCSALMRKDAVTAVGGFENSFRTLFEDYAFFLKFSLKHSVQISEKCWSKYRQHDDSCCVRADQERQVRSAWLRLLFWFRDYLDQTNQELTEVRDTLDQALRKARHPPLFKFSMGARNFGRRWFRRLISAIKIVIRRICSRN